MEDDETIERILGEVEIQRHTRDLAHDRLIERMRAALDAGAKLSAVARASGYTREHVARIRDGRGPKDA